MSIIYERIYNKLLKLSPTLLSLEAGDAQHSQSGAYMDLHLDVLSVSDDYVTLALAHNYELNGDLVPDPDMEIRIVKCMKMADALTYQDINIYQRVYRDDDSYYPNLKKSLNSFLNMWLSNCLAYGHHLKPRTDN